MGYNAPMSDFVSPISVDLGAKNTGVFFSHYSAHAAARAGLCAVRDGAQGRVYELEKDSYTLLMVGRTAARHARRGHDRRQMAKRLFRLIWREAMGLEWTAEVAQAVGFLMNRRGFSFLAEEYSGEVLREFPAALYRRLPKPLMGGLEKIRDALGGGGWGDGAESVDLEGVLQAVARDGESNVGVLLEAAVADSKRVRADLVVYGGVAALEKHCKKRLEDESIVPTKKDKWVNVSRWIVERWRDMGIKGIAPLLEGDARQLDVVAYLNGLSPQEAGEILSSLPKGWEAQEKNLKDCVWNFDVKNFKLEEEADNFQIAEEAGEAKIKAHDRAHLYHLAFALHCIHSEMRSGGRYRVKYFEEVRNAMGIGGEAGEDMQPMGRGRRVHGYMAVFCRMLDALDGRCAGADGVANLIGHVSNLELKPLRKYFNNPAYKAGDKWDEAKMAGLFDRWIRSEWRVGEEDKLKREEGGGQNYRDLLDKWNSHKKARDGSVVDFWMGESPEMTIPPYQDNNNRRPPKCQSLALNVAYLDEKYGGWKGWVDSLKNISEVDGYLEDYVQYLGALSSGRGRAYFGGNMTGDYGQDSGKRGEKELLARVLQFLFDRVKASDPLNLNEIYSWAKKIRQGGEGVEKAKADLREAIKGSFLPDALKVGVDFNSGEFASGSFLHLAYSYYRARQRAREGRIFIHPEYRKVAGRGFEDTGRYDGGGHLLVYCNHKPRQKRYQLLYDVAGLLQITPAELKAKLPKVGDGDDAGDNDAVAEWLDGGIKGLKNVCGGVADMQKEERGQLRSKIQTIYGRLRHEGCYAYRGAFVQVEDRKIKDALKKSRVKDAYKIYRLCKNAKDKWLALTAPFYGGDDGVRQGEERARLQGNPAAAVYQLAQLNNIAFKERGGNASTCAVCSADNARRMQMVGEGEEAHSKAQRLPAIEFRVIDGAVRRMARIVGGAIARDKWEVIAPVLKKGGKVRVPIVIESNRFEFEPSLRVIKGKPLSQKQREKDELMVGLQHKRYEDKEARIENASLGICPYTGDSLGNGGERDHIIPRSSRWGTLNDEANLIFASNRGNQEKGKREYYLSDLSPDYLQRQFETAAPDQIVAWIVETIGEGEGEDFKFGPYRNFINLSSDEQRAMRHALFLPASAAKGLREKVIRAIDNRTRAVVNGTQRYFVQGVADALHKLAKEAPDVDESNLEFDYYGVEAASNSRGDGIYDVRKAYEMAGGGEVIAKYKKEEGRGQEPYSHLIDAMVAFAIAASYHRGDGGLRIDLADGMGHGPRVDGEGEVFFEGSLLDGILVRPDAMEKCELKRRKAAEVESHDREKIQKNVRVTDIPYKIHRDGIVAENFFPLHVDEAEERVGFGFYANALRPYKWADYWRIRSFYLPSAVSGVLAADKRKIQNFLMEVGRRGGENKEELKICSLLDRLRYATLKQEVAKVLTPKQEKAPVTVGDALANWDKCVRKNDFVKTGVLLPIYREWQRLRAAMLRESPAVDLQSFVRGYMLKGRGNSALESHHKVRKVFSLPVVANFGNIRIARRSWVGDTIVQVQGEESLAKCGVDGKDRPHTFLSQNAVPIKHYSGIAESLPVYRLEWIRVPAADIAESDGLFAKFDGVLSVDVYNKEAGRCRLRMETKRLGDRLGEFPVAAVFSGGVDSWSGQIKLHGDEKALAKAQSKGGKNFNILKKDWRFFDAPFKWAGRDVMKIEKKGGVYRVEYTATKSTKIKEWLKNG